jgi:phenylacetate-CoA ligase
MDVAFARMLNDVHAIKFLESQSPAAVRKFQYHRVAKLLTHATKHSSWWRKRISAQGRLSFDKLPLMARHDLRDSIKAAGGALPIPSSHGSVQTNSTSGSSGVPVEFYGSSLTSRLTRASYWKDRVDKGFDPSKKLARFAVKMNPHEGPHVEVPGNPFIGRSPELVRRMQQFSVREHALWLASAGCPYMVIQPVLLAGLLDEYELGEIAPPRMEKVISYAESVTADLRLRTQSLLGARIIDRYSCEEVGPIAFQCPSNEDHYHVAISSVIVEVLNQDGYHCANGEIGRVHITGLNTYANPIVRYELGDLAALLPQCVCGHCHPTLTNLLGRQRFLILLPSGERKPVRITAKNWLAVMPVRETRIVQVSPYTIRAEFVMDRPPTGSERDALLGMLRQEISPELTYEVTQVQSIDWGQTYKRQDIVSLI